MSDNKNIENNKAEVDLFEKYLNIFSEIWKNTDDWVKPLLLLVVFLISIPIILFLLSPFGWALLFLVLMRFLDKE